MLLRFCLDRLRTSSATNPPLKLNPALMQDVKKDTNPDWSEHFQILCDSPPRDEFLFIRVWHRNRGKDKLLRAMTNIKHLMKANIEGKVRAPSHRFVANHWDSFFAESQVLVPLLWTSISWLPANRAFCHVALGDTQ